MIDPSLKNYPNYQIERDALTTTENLLNEFITICGQGIIYAQNTRSPKKDE